MHIAPTDLKTPRCADRIPSITIIQREESDMVKAVRELRNWEAAYIREEDLYSNDGGICFVNQNTMCYPSGNSKSDILVRRVHSILHTMDIDTSKAKNNVISREKLATGESIPVIALKQLMSKLFEPY